MFDGNVIYEMNPVGEINIPREDKVPNMNDDGKGKISIATGGSSGGGVRTFNIEYLNKEDIAEYYLIHGATLNDLKTVFFLNGVDSDDSTFTALYYYNEYDGEESLFTLSEFSVGTLYVDGNYLDGIKVYKLGASPQ